MRSFVVLWPSALLRVSHRCSFSSRRGASIVFGKRAGAINLARRCEAFRMTFLRQCHTNWYHTAAATLPLPIVPDRPTEFGPIVVARRTTQCIGHLMRTHIAPKTAAPNCCLHQSFFSERPGRSLPLTIQDHHFAPSFCVRDFFVCVLFEDNDEAGDFGQNLRFACKYWWSQLIFFARFMPRCSALPPLLASKH